MKVMIMDTILNDLKKLEKADLFGQKAKEVVIISALEPKKGIEKIGVILREKVLTKLSRYKDCFVLTMNEGELSCFYLDDNETTENIKIEVIPFTKEFQERNKDINDISALQQSIVTIIGLGSGGSATAIDLVRCGVSHLNLIDFDIVSTGNLCRADFDVFDIGKMKTKALYEKLIRINPNVNIQLYDEDVLEMEDERLSDIIDASDLIMEATDNVKTKILINGLAYHTTPVIYPSVYANGQGGEVLFTLPGLPCYECVFSSIIDEMKEIKKSEWDYSTEKPKSMPGLLADIQVVVARSVKLALALLTEDLEDSLLEKITEVDCTLLLIGNEKDFFLFDKPFQEVWVETKIDENCICQTLR